jgi:hypothetical protein
MKYHTAYIAGALTVSDHTEDIRSVYESIGKLCESLGITPYIPHAGGTDPVKNPDVTPSFVWKKDVGAIFNADVLIAYVGMPSLGVGAEIELARIAAKDVVLWWVEGEKVSRMARGNPAVVGEIIVRTKEELLVGLRKYLVQK